MNIRKLSLMLALAAAVSAHAQQADTDVKVTAGADIVSHYMWRGTDMGGIAIQPKLSVAWKGLQLQADGTTGLDAADPKKLDITLSYEQWGFTVGVKDYWTAGVDKNNRYFHYDQHGAHQLEATLGYSCPWGSLQAYTYFWGNDFKISGERAYSTYAELNVPFRLGGFEWNVAVGGTFFESAGHVSVLTEQGDFGDETHYVSNYFYAKGPACVMASLRATKAIDMGFTRLPVFAELHTNPYLQTAHLLFGLTIQPF